jgi:pyridinium-3,5-bisthiocarboxylic acid mononucleotide nickel chelatase
VSRLLYLDCFSGISGDMVLGALLDAGLPMDALKEALGSLTLDGYHVHAERVLRAGVSATKFIVNEHTDRVGGTGRIGRMGRTGKDHDHTHEHHHAHEQRVPSPESRAPSKGDGHSHRSLPEIYGLIDKSALSAPGRDRAKALFQRLAEVEAAIHDMPVEKVHLHEVGALDSIIDIVGAVFGLEWLGADQIVSSPLNVGGGMVQSAHGRFPVPAPATVKLLGSAPVYSGGAQQELVTPTGALLVSAYASSYGPIPAMTIEHVGYGAGDHDFPSTPNVLRILVGRPATAICVPSVVASGFNRTDATAGDRVIVIECEIDDMNPQLFGVAMDRLYAAGALEVFYVPVQMKKNRPGTLLTVIGTPDRRGALSDIIFKETTTIGIRYSEVDRECLRREIVPVETPIGCIRFKLAWRDGRLVNAVPEFDDCARLAAERQLPVKDVQTIALKAFDRGRP